MIWLNPVDVANTPNQQTNKFLFQFSTETDLRFLRQKNLQLLADIVERQLQA